MSKKKWLLVILCILLLAGYWKFYYKTWSETTVAGSADCIFALDIKRVTNTLIWNVITTPSQWKKISFSSKEKFSWKDMVKIPDYVFVFHSANQPGNAWYSIFDIKNSVDFEKGLQFYHFEKRESHSGRQEYFSNELGIELIKTAGKILVGNSAVADKNCIRQVADELFLNKEFMARKQLFKNIEASSHLSVQLAKNNFLKEDGIIMLNFDKNTITADASLVPQQSFSFTEHNFIYPEDGLCSAGFTQPSPRCYDLLSKSAREKISKAINFNIDSLLLSSNHYYELNITGISPRADSAISYTYDDNFNRVEKLVVNNVLEPSFGFNIHGDSIAAIYNFWNLHGQLERSGTGDLFLPMPFVKSFCRIKSGKELTIESAGFRDEGTRNTINCIFFLRLVFTKIPPELIRYLPGSLAKSLSNMESMQINFRKKEEKLRLELKIKKKKNSLPISDF